MRLVYSWLCDFVRVPGDPETIAREIGLRGFEVASVEHGDQPVIDFEITANRPDCLSHIGLAREASAIWGLPLRMPALADLSRVSGSGVRDPGSGVRGPGSGAGKSGHAEIDVRIEDPELCPRYCAQLFEVRIAPSPSWLQERLVAAGVRPISNIVDLTNYVMLELGQPMHAFDLDRLAGRRLVIRRARAREPLRTLDGEERALDSDMLVIADDERATAIGGVMGGSGSEIADGTAIIALESACFQPASIRRTSKRLGLKTEASSRFERGCDISAPPIGLARFGALLAHIEAGEPLGRVIDRYPAPRRPLEITLRAGRIARVLGEHVPAADVPRILEPLGFQVASTASGSDPRWLVTVPTFRVDVLREVDLIEEVGRHFGFERLPITFPALAAPQPPPDERVGRDRLVRQVLTASGFSESLTFAFIERGAALPFAWPGAAPALIANPLSEKFAVLRPSLLPGLLDSCAHNRRRGRKDVRLFEAGSRVTPAGEGRAAALAWCGAATEVHWSAPSRPVDLFDVKGVVELVLRAFGIAAQFAPVDRPYMVRGRSAEARVNGAMVAILGQLAPAVAAARGFPESEALYGAEIDTDLLGAANTGDELRTVPLPRFPSIVRDVSLLVDEALPAAAVRGTIRSAAPDTLVSIAEFDRYQGKGVPEGRVSLSLRLTFCAPDRTLTDDDAHVATERIVDALRERHGAARR